MNPTTKKPRATKRPPAGTISAVLRQTILDSGLSAYRLAQESGVNVAAVLRFRSGQRSLDLKSADRLAEVLDLELRPIRVRPKG
jgi:transcriptional regulator with XRE-family HTH domain